MSDRAARIATDIFRAMPSSACSDAGAGIRVVGFDTNYGTIEVKVDDGATGGQGDGSDGQKRSAPEA